MLLAIEGFVRVFEHLITERADRVDTLPAHNDNDDSNATTRRWAASLRS